MLKKNIYKKYIQLFCAENQSECITYLSIVFNDGFFDLPHQGDCYRQPNVMRSLSPSC